MQQTAKQWKLEDLDDFERSDPEQEQKYSTFVKGLWIGRTSTVGCKTEALPYFCF